MKKDLTSSFFHLFVISHQHSAPEVSGFGELSALDCDVGFSGLLVLTD